MPSVVPTANPELSGVGDFDLGEIVRGLDSQIEARVKKWDIDTKILEVSNIGIGTTQAAFIPGEIIQATKSVYFNVVSQVVANAGVRTNRISGISTAGLEIGYAVKESYTGAGNTIPVCGSGSTITGIFGGYVTIEPPCVNNILCSNCVITFGSTAYSNYSLDFFDEDNQSDDAFDDNQEIELEADQILDFSEGNPFGTF